MQQTVWTIILVLNALWFGMVSRDFGLTPATAAKLLVPREERGAPMFFTLSESIRFLGGMSFAFAVFAVLLLVFQGLFSDARQVALFARKPSSGGHGADRYWPTAADRRQPHAICRHHHRAWGTAQFVIPTSDGLYYERGHG